LFGKFAAFGFCTAPAAAVPPFFVVCGGFSVYTVLFIISSNKPHFKPRNLNNLRRMLKKRGREADFAADKAQAIREKANFGAEKGGKKTGAKRKEV